MKQTIDHTYRASHARSPAKEFRLGFVPVRIVLLPAYIHWVTRGAGMSLLTSISRYVLDDRLPARAGLPESSSATADPYLAELHELYPADIYPGGVYFELPEGQCALYRF